MNDQAAALASATRWRLALVFTGPTRLWIWFARCLGVRVNRPDVVDQALLRESEAGAASSSRWFLLALPVVLACAILANVVVTPVIIIAIELAQLPLWLNLMLTAIGAAIALIVALGPFLLLVRRSYIASAPTVSIALAVEQNPAVSMLLADYPRTQYAVRRLVSRGVRRQVMTER